jgi:CrcB protein
VADRRELAAIFVGGACGTLARAGLSHAFPLHEGHWPWPTFTANIVGCVLLGYFTTRLTERLPLSAYRRPMLGTGLCGGLTTFSTLQVEVLTMLDAGDHALAAAYLAASLTGGYLAVHLTTALTRRAWVWA